jgi:hypothetical protein
MTGQSLCITAINVLAHTALLSTYTKVAADRLPFGQLCVFRDSSPALP